MIYKLLTYIMIFSLHANCQHKKSSIPEITPNVIIILTNDQGYWDVGFKGCTDIPAPNIDRIANEGVKFTNGYVSYPVCGSSREGLIIRRYQDCLGFSRNPLFAPNDPDQGFPLIEETIASALDKVGYQTIALGKSYLGAHESLRPLNRGFDEFFGFLSGGHQYFPELWTLDDFSEVKSQFAEYETELLRNNERVDEQAYLTDALSREAVSFVERNAHQPFFMYQACIATHAPLQATEKYLSRFEHIEDNKRKTNAAMVSSVDDGVGDLLNKLSKLNIDKNTMVFFLSDNGGPYKVNGSRNDPLREGKGSLYDGGIRVPFAMRWPVMLKAGQMYEEPIISLDIFAVAADYDDSELQKPIGGVNNVPFINEEKPGDPYDCLFWRIFDSQFYAVRNEELKLVNMRAESGDLSDLILDIGQIDPLDQIGKRSKLFEAKESWNQQLMDPIFLGLSQNKEYNELHPDRLDLEPYG